MELCSKVGDEALAMSTSKFAKSKFSCGLTGARISSAAESAKLRLHPHLNTTRHSASVITNVQDTKS